MRNFLIIICLIASSCFHLKGIHKEEMKPKRISHDVRNFTSYKVYKIDSINNFYLIYVRRNDSLYKIVSKKEDVENCNRIQNNNTYDFILHARSENRTIDGVKILPQNSLLVNCFTYSTSTTICLERDSINDLHYADNLKGLCLIKQ